MVRCRFGGSGLVVLVAVVSYSHLRGLLVGYGEDPVTAVLGRSQSMG